MPNCDPSRVQILSARGIGLAFALVLLNLLMFLSVAAMYHFRQAKGVAASETRQRNLHFMAQAAYRVSMESSDLEGDGMIESPAMSIASPSPSDGGELPASSGAPRTDAWGTLFGYCAWDNGATNTSTNRLTGDNRWKRQFGCLCTGLRRAGPAVCHDLRQHQGRHGEG